MATRTIATDIHAALTQGRDAWHEDTGWPVSEPQFRALNRALDAGFDQAYGALDDAWRDLLLADFRFVAFLAQYLHARTVQDSAAQSGANLMVGRDSAQYYEVPWPDVGSEYRDWLRNRHFLPFLRMFRRRLVYGGDRSPFQALGDTLKRRDTWSFGAWDASKRGYIRSNNLSCEFPFVEHLAPKRSTKKMDGLHKTRAVLGDWLEKIDAGLRESGGTGITIDLLLGSWLDRLSDLGSLYEAVRRRRNLPETLIVGSLGNPLFRTVALAARRRGTKVVGFSHGHNMGYTHESARSYINIGISDEYVCATPKAVESLSALTRDVPFTRNTRTKFVSTNVPTYKNLWESHGGRAWPRKIRSVVIVGFPMHATRYIYGTGLFWNFKLDIEVRVARTLRASGIRVLYRPHPDTGQLMCTVMAQEVDEVLLQPFETAYRQADALLFTYPLTTTFGFALCSEKPVILIDMEGEAWYQDIYRLIKKRCALVGAKFDERNRVSFKTEDLHAAMEEALEKQDYEYVFTYLFPTPDETTAPQ